MKKLHRLMPLAALTALVVACAPDTDQTDEFDETVPAQPATEEAPAMTEDAEGPTLNVARIGDNNAAYLTDREGRAVYLLEGDTTGLACTEDCLDAWPPVEAEEGEGMIRPGDPSVQEPLIGRIQREDGTMQVTYNGHPLYYYAQDEGAGSTTGQDLTDQWGEWYLVTPEGEPLEGVEGSATTTQGQDTTTGYR